MFGFGFGGIRFGFGFSPETISTNCYPSLTQLTDGGYGYDEAQAIPGALALYTTSDGTHIYSASIYADGSFLMSFGVAGTTKLFADPEETNPVDIIIKAFGYDNLELNWNSTTLRYEGTNIPLAATIIERLGTEVCFFDVAIADKIIDIDFSEIEVI